MSWTGTRSGWLLSGRECHRRNSFSLAYRLLRTSDAGEHWQQMSLPDAGRTGGRIAFDTDGNGYLFNAERAWRTTDAGRHWVPMPGMRTEALSVDGRWVYRIGYRTSGCPGPCQTVVQQAATGTARWKTLLRRRTAFGSTLVASGSQLLVGIPGHPAGGAPNAHTVLFTSTDSGSTWHSVADPCGGHGRSEWDAYASAVHRGEMAIACARRSRLDARSEMTFSAGSGTRFTAKKPTALYMIWVVAYVHHTLVAGESTPRGRLDVGITTTANAGASWTQPFTEQSPPRDSYLDNGPVLSCAGDGCAYLADPRGLLVSTDGAKTWTRVGWSVTG